MGNYRYYVNPAPGYDIGDEKLEFAQYFRNKWSEEVVNIFNKHSIESVGCGLAPFTLLVSAKSFNKADKKIQKFLDDLIDELVGLNNTDLRFKIKRRDVNSIPWIVGNKTL